MVKQRAAKKDQKDPEGLKVSLRLDVPIAERFERVVSASRRTKTSIIEECLEKALTTLEKQYKQAA